MSDKGNKKLFDHYTNVINGNVKSGNAVRDDLNVSDAKRHLADLIAKNPGLSGKEPEYISGTDSVIAPDGDSTIQKTTKSKKVK